MNREEKIARIYQEIADKTLSFGCKISVETIHPVFGHFQDEVWYVSNICDDGTIECGGINPSYVIEEFNIIGHPVMIGDVLEYMDQNMPRNYSGEANIYIDQIMKLTGVRRQKRLPLNDQSDDCIDFILSLLPQDDQ